MVLGQLPNTNPKPNPDPNRGAVFLGGSNFPDTVHRQMIKYSLFVNFREKGQYLMDNILTGL